MKTRLLLILAISTTWLATSFPFRAQANPETLKDNVSQTLWWQTAVLSQIDSTKEKHYQGCIWGDSISSALSRSLGTENFNFAIGGMSSVSLLEQLKLLKQNHIQCDRSIVAIGTNDAMYGISDEAFTNNLKAAITTLRSMGNPKIILIPAFYSTVAASKKPDVAGTLERIDEINNLIDQVAASEAVTVESEGIQELYQNHALRQDLTIDGVHLNETGLELYRKFLLKILSSSTGCSKVSNLIH